VDPVTGLRPEIAMNARSIWNAQGIWFGGLVVCAALGAAANRGHADQPVPPPQAPAQAPVEPQAGPDPLPAPAPLAFPAPQPAPLPPAGVVEPAFPPPQPPVPEAVTQGNLVPAADARIGTLPARKVWQDQPQVVPEVTCEQLVPVFETVKVPVYETRRVPITAERDVPVVGTREVPVFADQRVAEHGPVVVPTYEHRRVPVTLTIPNPFECDDWCLELWDRCECVQNGTRVEQGVVGWRSERVQVGTRAEPVVTGSRKETVTVGERLVQVQVGEREERRQVGTETKLVVLRPATNRTVRVCIEQPAEHVTVVADAQAANAAPIVGTTRVLGESEFRRLAQATTR
jgi:hypothetical protein